MIEKITPDAINPDKFDKLITSLRTAPPIADKLNAISNNGNGNDNDNRNGHNNHGERDDDYYLNLNKDPRISLYRTISIQFRNETNRYCYACNLHSTRYHHHVI